MTHLLYSKDEWSNKFMTSRKSKEKSKYVGGMEKPEKAQTISNLRPRFKTKEQFLF